MISLRNSLLSLFVVFLFSISWAASDHTNETFVQCLSHQFQNSTTFSQVIYTPQDPSYLSVLNFSAQNQRFTTPTTPRPLVIITPFCESDIQRAVYCSRKHDIQIRIRSGGHDYEGLSYVSPVPFTIIDLINMRSVNVNAEEKTAWIQAGATLGEVYYYIANSSRTLAFPAGICPSVGVGGHFSGGGYGMLLRKFGLAADHIIDARLVDVKGRILNRKTMGEDLFWALRGGGSASFGVITAWKVNLVTVPEIVTVFQVNRTLEQNATRLIYQWQHFAEKIDENLFIRIFVRNTVNATQGRTVAASFPTLFLGRADRLLELMQENFPDLGLLEQDCTEMSWIDSVLYFFGGVALDDLLNRTFPYVSSYKLKSDYVKEPIPESVIEGIWERYKNEEISVPLIVLNAYGGAMSKISASASPFPHRAGNKYHMEYQVSWDEAGTEASERHISWIRELYNYMSPYVSKNPREAYVNYRDLDIGVNNIEGDTSYAQASIWGSKYYKNNFRRLVYVKTLVDPDNFFRNEQSIPSLGSSWIRRFDHQPSVGKAYE